MATYTVTLHGAPIASVDLPVDRLWAGGRVTPLAGFGQVAPLVEAARGAPALVARLLDLRSGDPWPTDAADDLPEDVVVAYQHLAALPFELRDEAGLPTGAELVRLGPIGIAPDAVVRVYFRQAPASVGAPPAPPPTADGRGADAPGA